MFNIPSLPFDSIYKFLFVGGLIFIISSVYIKNNGLKVRLNQTVKLDSIEKNYELRTSMFEKIYDHKKNINIDSIYKDDYNTQKLFEDFHIELDRLNLTNNQYDSFFILFEYNGVTGCRDGNNGRSWVV